MTEVVSAVSQGVNSVWILIVSFMIFFMQPGFAMLEAGQVRSRHVANVLMKNLMDWCLGVIVYFFIGLGIAGLAGAITSPSTSTIGQAFAYLNDPGAWINWLFGAVFAMTAATIVSGAVASRIKFKAYLFYSIGLTAIIYPVIQGFAWGGGLLSADGYLGSLIGAGYIDFAGATVVHMLGGVAGLVGAAMVGPRRGRFDTDGNSVPIPGHSLLLAVLGTFILAFGWYGFNVGTQASVLALGGESLQFMGDALGRVALNTTLAMGAGAIGAVLVTIYKEGKPDPLFACNGLLAGLVGITGACAAVTQWGGLFIGFISGVQAPIVYSWVVRNMKIDDVCGVFAVHGSAGALGTWLIPFFATAGFSGTQLLMQTVGIGVIVLWTIGATYLVFKLASVTVGLRVTAAEEQQGLDITEHDVTAYPEFGPETAEVPGI